LLKVSKPAWPWIAPMPLGPMPPNGSVSTAKCTSVSLTATPPASVASTMRFDRRVFVGERIERQRAIVRADVIQCVVQPRVRAHREDRPEDLVAHDVRIVRCIEHQRRRQAGVRCACALHPRR
jgi:hypothetical protein